MHLGAATKDSLRKTQLGIGPDGLGVDSALDNASAAAGGLPLAGALQSVALPDTLERANQVAHHLLAVSGGRGNAQTLLAAGHGGVVDRLDVDAVRAQELVRGRLADLGIADKDGDNVRRVGHNRDVQGGELGLEGAGVGLLGNALVGRVAEVLDRSGGTGNNGGREGGGEDETGSIGSDHVDHGSRAGNIAAHNTKSLAKRAGNDIDLVHFCADGAAERAVQVLGKVEVLSHTGTVRAVHADGVDLVQEGDSAVLLGKAANVVDLANGAGHGVDGLKGNDLGDRGVQGLEELLEMGGVVVSKDHLLDTRVLNTLDHGSVVHRVGENDASRQLLGQSAQSSIVGNIAGREDQSSRLVVQGSELILESQVVGAVTSNVASASSTSAILAEGGLHGLDDDGVLAHAEVVVRAPHGDLVLGLCGVGARELLSQAVDVVEEAVGLVLVLLVQLLLVGGLVVKSLAGGGDSMGSRDHGLEGAG